MAQISANISSTRSAPGPQTKILLHDETARVQVLAEVSRSLSEAGTSFQVVVDQAARRIAELTGDVCSLSLMSEDDELLQTAVIGFPSEEHVPEGLKIAIDQAGKEFAESVVRSGEMVLLSDQLKQVFLNICLNTIEAMQPNGGKLRITLVASSDSKQVGVIVKDAGPGIPAEYLPRIFQPLFTIKEFGLGLWLSITACNPPF